MFSMPYGNTNQSPGDVFNDQSALQELLNFQKSLDRTNFELPDLRKLSLSNDNASSSESFSGFMQDAGKSNRETDSIQVRVPTSEHVAEIVGKQGCKIKSLRYSTKTYIQTPARDQEPVFTISGYPEDVERAKRRIEEAAEHFTKIRQGRENNSPVTPQLGPNAVVRYVRVPLKYVGLVVGPKGHNIKRIQSETDTYIMTPARDKEPIFEIRGAPEKVAEAENKLQIYIAMRTGGMFDDYDHLVDVDLKKPMMPPKALGSFSSMQSSFGSNKTWGKPDPALYTDLPNYNASPEPTTQLSTAPFDPSRVDLDSGYNSPNFDNRKDLQALMMVIDTIQSMQNSNHGQNFQNVAGQQTQQQTGTLYPRAWSHSGVF